MSFRRGLATSQRSLLGSRTSSWLSFRRTNSKGSKFPSEENIIATDDIVSAKYILSKIKQAQNNIHLTAIEFEDLVLKDDGRVAIFHATKNLLAYDGSRPWRHIRFVDQIRVRNSGDGAVQQLNHYVTQQGELKLKISRVSRGKPVIFQTKLEIHAGTDVNAICDLFSALRQLNVSRLEFGGSLFSIQEDKIAQSLADLCCSPVECEAADPKGSDTVLGEMILVTIVWGETGASCFPATSGSAKAILSGCILKLNCLVALRACCQQPSSSFSSSTTSSSKRGRRTNMRVGRSTRIVMSQITQTPRHAPSDPASEPFTLPSQSLQEIRNSKPESNMRRTKSVTVTANLDHMLGLNTAKKTLSPSDDHNDVPKRIAISRPSGKIRVSREDCMSRWESKQTIRKTKSLDSDPRWASSNSGPLDEKPESQSVTTAPITKRSSKRLTELTRRHTTTIKGDRRPIKIKRVKSAGSEAFADYDWVLNRATGYDDSFLSMKGKPDFRWDKVHHDRDVCQYTAVSA